MQCLAITAWLCRLHGKVQDLSPSVLEGCQVSHISKVDLSRL